MDTAIIYLVVGLVIGAAGALILMGILLGLRPSSSNEASPSELTSGSDRSIRLIPITSGEWMVEAGGRRYRKLSEVQDAAVARHIRDMLDSLGQFTAGPAIVPPPAQPAAPAPPPQVEEQFLRSLQAPPPRPAAKTAPRPAPADTGPGIAGQIEQVLQQRLERTPNPPARELHVSTAADGSLRVEVNGKFYPGIDAVPDPAVREFLQATIKEWEAQI